MLQERFSGLVSLDLLSEEEMPHGSLIQGPLRVLLFHPLAGDGTKLHFEYMFKITLDRVCYYCCCLFPCWLCLILYKQICNCRGISQALANVYHCATGCSVCCLTFMINIHKHILGTLESKEVLQGIGNIIQAVLL